jgi:Spy/CpxP family protein refolding chaperone
MTRRILMVGLAAAAIAFAQRGAGGGGRGGGSLAPNIGFGPGSKLDRITQSLKLSKEQKKDLKETFDEAQKEAAPVHEEIVKARLEIGEAVAAGKPADEITKDVKGEGALEAQMAAIELKAFAKFAGTLEPEQQQRAGMVFIMMPGIFSNKNWNSD